MNITTKQYINVLLDTNSEGNKLIAWVNNLEKINSKELVFKQFLTDPQESWNKKEEKLLSYDLDKVLINFLHLMISNNDFAKLSSIVSGLKKIINEKTDSLDIEVELAKNISENEKELIIKSLTKKTNKKVVAKFNINPELIGGMIIKIDDSVIDNSFKTKLENLSQKLII